MLTLKSVAKDKTLDELGIESGSRLLTINGRDVCDCLDYRFYSADDHLLMLFETEHGQQVELEIDFEDLADLQLQFEPDTPKHCDNNCVFCFIHQLPKGLRRSLYFKDEDYRLSFQHGNYITLTNITEDDFCRIEEQKLSPLYISVHSTDDRLRRRMLGNDEIPPIVPQMRRLIAADIELHAQVVLCPGWNDGEHLRKTMDDLAQLYPGVRSVAVVPVGLTKHRLRLPALDAVSPEHASAVVEELLQTGERLHRRFGVRFVYPADEFFLLAGVDVPDESYYDGFPQVENGVGMVRRLIDSSSASGVSPRRHLRLIVVTGSLIAPILSTVLERSWSDVRNMEFEVIPVINRMLGESVTVSGLICGQDIIETLSDSDAAGDAVVAPPDCLNDDGLFLDDLRLSNISERFGCPAIQAEYSPADTLQKVIREIAN